jgi:transposase
VALLLGADSPKAALPNVKNIALYDYQNSRARACSVAFLGDYNGYLQTDGYGAYICAGVAGDCYFYRDR